MSKRGPFAPLERAKFHARNRENIVIETNPFESLSTELHQSSSDITRDQRLAWYFDELGLDKVSSFPQELRERSDLLALWFDDALREEKERPLPDASSPPVMVSSMTLHLHKQVTIPIIRSRTEDSRIVERTMLPIVTDRAKQYIDLTGNPGTFEVKYSPDFERTLKKQTMKEVQLTRVNSQTEDLKERLRLLPRRSSDGACFGLILLTVKKDYKQGKWMNFFVDKNNVVYFIDVQEGMIKFELNSKFYSCDVFFALSRPKESFLIKQENISQQVESKEESFSFTQLKKEYLPSYQADCFKNRKMLKDNEERKSYKLKV